MTTHTYDPFGVPAGLSRAYFRGVLYVTAHLAIFSAIVATETVLSNRFDHGLLYGALATGLYLGIRGMAPRALVKLALSARVEPAGSGPALRAGGAPLQKPAFEAWPLRFVGSLPGARAWLEPRLRLTSDGIALETRLGSRLISFREIARASGDSCGIRLVLKDGRTLDLVTRELPGGLLALVYAPLARELLSAKLAVLARNERVAEHISRALSD